jgi:hypothetical protein
MTADNTRTGDQHHRSTDPSSVKESSWDTGLGSDPAPKVPDGWGGTGGGTSSAGSTEQGSASTGQED